MSYRDARSRTRDASFALHVLRRGGIAAILCCVLAGAPAPAISDSLTFLGQGGTGYWYLATTGSDFFWEAGDVI
ncbi:MAG: hypothetical protein ACE5JM_08450, partial [Armatimonadota bacterium]